MLSALAGGLLIGISASLAWSGAREVAGISGIVGRVLREPLRTGFHVWFLVGLLLTSALVGRLSGPWQATDLVPRSVPWILAAGLLVGFGTQLGSGCTSGHGVCGISRLAPRSIVATLTFMVVAGAVVFVTRHALAGGGS
jgi:uncharacterized membrane protein YedE/YeeE